MSNFYGSRYELDKRLSKIWLKATITPYFIVPFNLLITNRGIFWKILSKGLLSSYNFLYIYLSISNRKISRNEKNGHGKIQRSNNYCDVNISLRKYESFMLFMVQVEVSYIMKVSRNWKLKIKLTHLDTLQTDFFFTNHFSRQKFQTNIINSVLNDVSNDNTSHFKQSLKIFLVDTTFSYILFLRPPSLSIQPSFSFVKTKWNSLPLYLSMFYFRMTVLC